jgi:hypothetical protein
MEKKKKRKRRTWVSPLVNVNKCDMVEEVIISQGSEGTACPLRNGGRGYNKPGVRGDSMSPEKWWKRL